MGRVSVGRESSPVGKTHGFRGNFIYPASGDERYRDLGGIWDANSNYIPPPKGGRALLRETSGCVSPIGYVNKSRENVGITSSNLARYILSLENAGESSVLPILRSVRLVLELLASGELGSVLSSSNGVDTKMMQYLVHSSWILHVSCNKRRVAPIAALLSSLLHSSVFGEARMHETVDDTQGPLKWVVVGQVKGIRRDKAKAVCPCPPARDALTISNEFVGKILDEGMRSPRTIRLASLHLTGSWLLYPKIIKYYIKELKLLSLYGSGPSKGSERLIVAQKHVRLLSSLWVIGFAMTIKSIVCCLQVAFDEDFEAELTESRDARIEVSLLAESPNPEFTEAFINTELYARVSVAVLFYNLAHLADKSGSKNENEDCRDALHSGKLFLIELLDSVITNDVARRATFKKRRKGLMKKVSELSTLCGVNAYAIVYGGDDSPPEIWPSQSDVQRVLNRYNNLPEMEKSKNMMNLKSFLRKSITRLKSNVKKQQRDNKEYERTQLLHETVRDTNALQGVGTDEPSDLVCLVEETMKAIEERTDALSKNGSHQQKFHNITELSGKISE
ncbi:hypothetical protein GIB67_021608 [Kingdonia uniflora]|uniref:MADS-box domain-containing protein n=1 Tax=Kingdonia uniflora TaxID=39325 RepID=A0A7J7MDL3_9MAGN|nr:hypothetical protein GIB67_021608 [Kingdonia uniflora]